MTSEEYQQKRKRLGMTQGALADTLEVARKTINAREQTDAKIGKEAEMAILYLELTTEPEAKPAE